MRNICHSASVSSQIRVDFAICTPESPHERSHQDRRDSNRASLTNESFQILAVGRGTCCGDVSVTVSLWPNESPCSRVSSRGTLPITLFTVRLCACSTLRHINAIDRRFQFAQKGAAVSRVFRSASSRRLDRCAPLRLVSASRRSADRTNAPGCLARSRGTKYRRAKQLLLQELLLIHSSWSFEEREESIEKTQIVEKKKKLLLMAGLAAFPELMTKLAAAAICSAQRCAADNNAYVFRTTGR